MKINSSDLTRAKSSVKPKVNFGVKHHFPTSQSVHTQDTSLALLKTLKKAMTSLQNIVKPLLSSKVHQEAEEKEVEKKEKKLEEVEKKMEDYISDGTIRSMQNFFPSDEQKDITLKTFAPHFDKAKKSVVYKLPDFVKALDVQLSVQNMKTYTSENMPGLTIFNQEVAEHMQSSYNKGTLASMKKLLSDNNVFQFGIDENTGLPRTSGVSADENWEMGARVWITDSMHIANDYMRYNDKKTLKATLNTFASFYADNAQKEIFDNVHKAAKYSDESGQQHNEYYEPQVYSEEQHNMNGIAHVLIAKNGKCTPDTQWFNNKRLESHGLALQTFSKMIISGLRDDNTKEYGYASTEEIPDKVTTSMAYLVRYFDDINYPYARTAGNWEEVPFAGGTATDTATIVKALTTFSDLMFNPKYDNNENIQQVRTKINKNMKEICFVCTQDSIQNMINNGYQRLSEAFTGEGFKEHIKRPYDATSLFITNMNGLKLAENPLEDINKKMLILEQLENQLVGDYGIMRYKDDSYLNTNYNIAQTPNAEISFTWKEQLDAFGSKDASTLKAQEERKKLVEKTNHEAQWTFQSQMSVGYLKLLNQLNSAIEDGSITLNEETTQLAQTLKAKADLNLNRALARITDVDPSSSYQIKANGEASPAWAVPEAYQAVTSINPESKKVESKYTVGINTPLAWGQCGLYKAFYSYEKLLKNLTPKLSQTLGLE